MPNQRGSNKKKVNIWVTDEEKAFLAEAAKAQGMTVTDFIKFASTLAAARLKGASGTGKAD